MQSMPYAGYTGEYYPFRIVNGVQVPVKLYAQKHDPYMYFPAIRNNSVRLNKVVPFTGFESDLQFRECTKFRMDQP